MKKIEFGNDKIKVTIEVNQKDIEELIKDFKTEDFITIITSDGISIAVGSKIFIMSARNLISSQMISPIIMMLIKIIYSDNNIIAIDKMETQQVNTNII